MLVAWAWWGWGWGWSTRLARRRSTPLTAFDALDTLRNTTVLNSKVISVTVKPPPRSLLTPLEIEFAHMYNVSAAHVRGCRGTLSPALGAPLRVPLGHYS